MITKVHCHYEKMIAIIMKQLLLSKPLCKKNLVVVLKGILVLLCEDGLVGYHSVKNNCDEM